MTAIQGTNVAATIAPFDTADTHPTHDAMYGKGGWRSVTTIAARDGIPAQRRTSGMIVRVTDDPTPANNGEWEWDGGAWVVAPLRQRVTDLEDRAATAETDIDTLDGRATVLEGQATTSAADIDALEGRATALEGRTTTAEGDIDALEGRATTLETRAATLEGRSTEAEADIGTLEGRATALEERTATAEADIDTLEGRATAAESDIDTLEGRATEADEDIKHVARVASKGMERQRNFRALFSGFDDQADYLEFDEGHALVGGPTVITQLVAEVDKGFDACNAQLGRALLSSFDDEKLSADVDESGSLVGGPAVTERLLESSDKGVAAYHKIAKRALLSRFNDKEGEFALDEGGNLVGGPMVINQLMAEFDTLLDAYSFQLGRALLSGFDDDQFSVEIDESGGLVGGPSVTERILESSEKGVIAYWNVARRALLSDFTGKEGELALDESGSLVGGPAVIEALVEVIDNVGSATWSSASRQPVYLQGGDLMVVGSSGYEVIADISPANFIASAQWRGPAVITATDRPGHGDSTPVAVTKLDDGYRSVIPSSPDLLIVIPAYGQSNSVGAQSYDPPDATKINYWPESLLMFDLATGVPDVRMGLPSGSNTITLLDGDNLVGFTPLISVRSPVAPDRGATVLEGFGFAFQKMASERLGFNPRILMFAAGWGGQGYSNIQKGTDVYTNLITALTRAKALADENGWTMYVPCVQFVHGEADSNNSNYAANVLTLQADIESDVKAITGQAGSVPFVSAQPSSFYGDNTYGAQGIYDACKSSPLHVLSGLSYPYVMADDNLHLGNRGIYLGEKMARSALRDLKMWGLTGKSTLKPTSVTFDGVNEIIVELDVPLGPVVRDTSDPIVNNPAPSSWGFEVFDGAGSAVTISSIEIVGDSIRIVTASTPVSGASRSVRYAMTGYPDGERITGLQPRGQVRDSDSTPSLWDGKPLYNWLCHFSENF